MKTLDHIPTSKIERAGKLVKTGVKIGGNYVKYYGEKLLNPEGAQERLNEENATDIYNGLKSLKGSALKVAQMLSMEKNLLPQAYVERFSLSQFSVPPLSAPLVRKTFFKYFGRYPEALFDNFGKNAINAASIGQVHKAEKDGKQLAVKIQYPGVASSIKSDLTIVKPIALKMFNLPAKDADKYFDEVENKLLEETNYLLELENSKQLTEACSILPNLRFPKYYPELSNKRIITMDWMTGQHVSEFAKTDFNSKVGDQLGQTLWDFYMFQMHQLKKVHADPHPGNFMISENHELIAIDFGCVKEIPESFYKPYFELAQQHVLNDDKLLETKLFELEILMPSDASEELLFFKKLFKEMLLIFSKPFQTETFDFSNEEFWESIATLSDTFAKDPKIRSRNNNRGSKHFIYINRTFFGLYNLLHDLKAKVVTNNFQQYLT